MKREEKKKKPFYKKWWFWLIVLIVIIVGISPNNNSKKSSKRDNTVEQKSQKNTKNELKKTKTNSSKSNDEDRSKQKDNPNVKKEAKHKAEKKKSSSNREKTYELDKLVKEYASSEQTLMTYEDYNNFAVNGLTLEGTISKYGIPSNYIGGRKGDSVIEVTYPSDEKGYSVDLTFKKIKKNGFGDWFLSNKFAVKNDGIRLNKYTDPRNR